MGPGETHLVASPDGTRIAVFSAVRPSEEAAPVLLVHGTTSDHRTWRVVGPMLARRFAVHAVDRRGRGASGDGAAGVYGATRELDDLVAVCEAIREVAGRPVDVIGHSLGGRLALGASLHTDAIRRVVAYESAPTGPIREPGQRDRLLEALRGDLAAGEHDRLLERFMREGVGMTDADLAAFRADPIWPLRAAAAPTIVRELEAAEADRAIGLEALSRVMVPVLQLVGSLSPAAFRDGARTLADRLANGRLEVIDGARHGAHHSHPEIFVGLVEAFLATDEAILAR